ncbi:MAG: acyl-CoA dehydrogenase [Streptosporangiaceae bacterium]|nr:acyl-CoA dehydrogenase [Streptosporangiaceae bacterium]
MDLSFSDRQQAFRAEVRAWLAAHVPSEPLPSMDTVEGFERHRAWERELAGARLSVVSWPEEFGGRAADLTDWLIFEEEYWAAGAPGRVSQNGIFLLAPTLMAYGTDEQKRRFLPAMATAGQVWAQAWSEPEAGSDLASLRATATPEGDGWRLNGQKTWSSRAVYADWGFGLFRSDPESERHRGLTYYLFPLDAEGVTVRPIAQLDGDPGFAEIFFDDVFVPGDQVLGGIGQGWKVAMATTSSERGLTLRSPGRFMATADRLLALARTSADQTLRDAAVQAWLDADAYRLHTFQAVARLEEGIELGADSSLMKVFWSELDLRLHELALELLGPRATLSAGAPDAAGRWLDGFLFSLAGPIYAGTNEIQRNIIAERVLGLPR